MSEHSMFLVSREFTKKEIEDICEIVAMFPKLSRTELMQTICENLEWYTATGRNKLESCNLLLERLERAGILHLPEKRKIRSGKDKAVLITDKTDPPSTVNGNLAEVGPLELQTASDKASRDLWNEYVHRYHPLGYKRPFGAHQRYFVSSPVGYLGCLLFAASAWALADRDRWIGWNERDRAKRLHLVVNNTRFLLFPWVQVRYLASKVLSLAMRQIRDDWQARYNYAPVLVETFVDLALYRGTCYKAANWLCLGRTAGRGRMDRYNEYSSTPKWVFAYPLRANCREVLRGEQHE